MKRLCPSIDGLKPDRRRQNKTVIESLPMKGSDFQVKKRVVSLMLLALLLVLTLPAPAAAASDVQPHIIVNGAEALCEDYAIDGECYGKLRDLAALLKRLALPVSGTRSFEQAQVCCGGVPLSELTGPRLESSICPGLFFTGELLDVDGPCGGYNLQWAWSSGFAAGMAAARETV